MLAWFSGCLIRSAETDDVAFLMWTGILPLTLESRRGAHSAPTGAIEFENTHNMAGGRVFPQEVIDDICDRAHDAGVPVHMDGARVFNASVASGKPVSAIVAKVDTVMFCLSKALGAPVGSIVAGPAKLIDKGRLLRKRLGGAMRQVGVLAGGRRVSYVWRNRPGVCMWIMRTLGFWRGNWPGSTALVRPVETNIVIFTSPPDSRHAPQPRR